MREHKYNILYVDDEESNLRVFKTTFMWDYEVFTAISGEEGLKILNEQEIALVITDQRMPQMTGVEFLKQAMQRNPDPPRILLTGFSDLEAVRHAINEGGIWRYISKPWDADEMRHVLDKALEVYQLRIDNKLLIENLQETNQQLKESERRMTTLLDNLPGMAYRCENEPGWPLEFVSEGCLELTGKPANDLIGASLGELVLPEYKGRLWETVQKALNEDRPYELIYPIKVSDEVKWLWEKGQSIGHNSNGRVVLEGFITDISARKRAEDELKKALDQVENMKDQLQEENSYLKEEIKLNHNFEEIISQSDLFRKVLAKVEQVASTDSTVLIMGETGTGKELLARAVHNLSKRRTRPLVKVNCAALPANLIESELFGHEKGAFTGALNKKIGRFELADGGTLFLDEIGEMPMELQAKLLRVLQEGEFERLGSTKTVRVDVRLIAATNRNLEESIKQGEFREDLYYRLNVFPILNPPLRQRKEDIPVLVNHFVEIYGAKTGKKIEIIPKDVMDRLIQYDWPGNVRELENVVERSIIISQSNRLQLGDWIDKQKPTPKTDDLMPLRDMEIKHIKHVLEHTNWRVSGPKGAANILGMNPKTLDSRMRKLGISREK